MSFAVFALALVAVGPGTGPTPARGPAASTYDEAACASVQAAEADGWDRAAIGETELPILLAREEACQPLAAAPVNDCAPAASWWVADVFVRCDMPRMRDIFAPHPHLGRPHGDRHAPRFSLLLLTSDGAAPLASASGHDTPPAVLASVLVVVPPAPRLASYGARLAPLGAVRSHELLRPPQS